MTTTSASGLPLPENTDILVAQKAFGEYAVALDDILLPQYATTAARDAAMAGGKIAGQACTVAGEFQMWDGAQWWCPQDARFIYKSADTSRASTTTPTVDPHLQYAVKAGGTYLFQFWVPYTSAATAPQLLATVASVGGGVIFNNRFTVGPQAASPDRTNTTLTNVTAGAGSGINTGTPGGTSNLYYTSLTGVCVADDTVGFYWSQAVSNATPTIVKQNALMEIRRIT